jgi:hypothetical protein
VAAAPLDATTKGAGMKGFGRVAGVLLGALAVGVAGVVAGPAAGAGAAIEERLPDEAACHDFLRRECGRVINWTPVEIKVRSYHDAQSRWVENTVPPWQSLGGYDYGRVDVDQVLVPPGCVADTQVDQRFGDDYQIYLPAGWDKLTGWDTYKLTGRNCGTDGRVYAWEHIWDNDNLSRKYCSWYYADANWEDNCGNFRNRASSFQNNSSSGNAVNFYFNPGYLGAWACLGPGDVWRDARYNYFSHGPNLPGYMWSINDEVASSKFVSRCGNP